VRSGQGIARHTCAVPTASRSDAPPGSARAAEVLRRVRAIPEGFVSTYGDVCPGAPRFAGMVLSECHDPGVPWQRVVRADGSLAKGARQRRLLEREGVPFRGDRVEMEVALVAPEVLDG
jgi:methylated-DNA-protein-cysteine methyltransferase related protein